MAEQVRRLAERSQREGRAKDARLLGETAAELAALLVELAVSRATVRGLEVRLQVAEKHLATMHGRRRLVDAVDGPSVERTFRA